MDINFFTTGSIVGITLIGIVAYLFRPVLKEWISRSSQLLIDKKNRRIEAVNKFRKVFIEEREKIKTFNIQNDFIQEKAIYEINRFISRRQTFCLKHLWREYQTVENKYRQAIQTQDKPPNTLIYYGDYKNEVLSKIDEIINYLK